MAYTTLKAAIQAAIKNNDNEEITGDILQGVLLSIVNSVGSGYNLAGVATPSTNPGTPDGSMFWIGGKGTYMNFGSTIAVPAGSLGLFMWDGSSFSSQVVDLSNVSVSPNINTGGYDLTVGDVVLKAINAGYEFKGIAWQSTNPGSPDGKVFYIASPNTYQYFGDYVVPAGCIGIFMFNEESWVKEHFEVSVGDTDSIRRAIGYFFCDTSYATAEKRITADSYSLIAGGCIKIKFNSMNVAQNPTLNVNGTGAKTIVYNGKVATDTYSWGDGEVVEFYYDDTYNNNAGAWIGHSIDFDETPLRESHKLVDSGAIWKAIIDVSSQINGVVFDEAVTENNEILITSDVLAVGDVVEFNTHQLEPNGGLSFRNASDEELDSIMFSTQYLQVVIIPEGFAYIRAIWSPNFTRLTITDKTKIKAVSADEVFVKENDENKINSLKLSGEIIVPTEVLSPLELAWITGGYFAYNSSNQIVFMESNDWCYTETPITVAGTYKLKCYSYYWDVASYVVYDSNNQVLFTGAKSGNGNKLWVEATLELPSGAKVCFSSRPYTSESSDRQQITLKQLVSVVPYLNGLKITPYALNGIKWGAIGDSLTDHTNADFKHYIDYIAEQTGVEAVNYGVSGSGYKARSGEGLAFYQRALNIASDLDVVTIFGSGNDGGEAELGEYTDTGTTTLAGCINTTISNILSVNPLVRIGIITPTPWGSYNPKNTSGSGTWMRQYSELIVKICDYWGIPCLNLYLKSNLRPWDATQAEDLYLGNGDTTHPNAEGHKRIASMIKAFLMKIAG